MLIHPFYISMSSHLNHPEAYSFLTVIWNVQIPPFIFFLLKKMLWICWKILLWWQFQTDHMYSVSKTNLQTGYLVSSVAWLCWYKCIFIMVHHPTLHIFNNASVLAVKKMHIHSASYVDLFFFLCLTQIRSDFSCHNDNFLWKKRLKCQIAAFNYFYINTALLDHCLIKGWLLFLKDPY